MHKRKIKIWLILVASLLSPIIIFVFVDPIAQDLSYHDFADKNRFFGIDNSLNVLSNLPFILFGLIGFIHCLRFKNLFLSTNTFPIFSVFFLGIILTGFGSSYYHLTPNNSTLLWDRLPMTIAFMAFFSFIIHQHISKIWAQFFLLPLILVGISSVLYWNHSESLNAGDLRFYALVQFLPMMLIPIIVCAFKTDAYQTHFIWMTMGFYVTAKILEHFDDAIYAVLPISGHSLKHVAAAFAAVTILHAAKSLKTDN